MSTNPLDRVAWSSLIGDHRHLANIDPTGRAAKYRKDVGLFGAMAEPNIDGWAAAASITRLGGIFGLFQADVEQPPTDHWENLFQESVDQFVAGAMREEAPLADGAEIVELDLPELERIA